MTRLTHYTDNLSAALQTEAAACPPRSSRLGDLAMMAKPRLTAMVVVTAYIGYAIGMKSLGGAPVATITLLATLLGVAFSCIGAGVLNQVYERDTDALMTRTQGRPLPGGRMGVGAATAIGLGTCVLGVGVLAVWANPLAAVLSLLTILSYVLVYTPMKRVSSLSTIVGAVPGALPPVMGFAAATGHIGTEAVLMFAILFLWQLPHFLAIAWLYREQYARAGMALLPVIDPSGGSTFRQALLGCLALVPLGLLPTMMGICGLTYFFGSLTAGVVFLGSAVALVIGRTRSHARVMFYMSLAYLPLVYLLMLLDYTRVG